MKSTVIAGWLLVALWPLSAGAELHKCKQSNGRIVYSDQPCETGATSVTPPPAPAVPAARAQPVTAVPRSNDSAPAEKPSGNSGRGSAGLSQRDRDMVREFNAISDRYEAELAQRCRSGDGQACLEQACSTFATHKGPAEHFVTCAKSKGLTMGRYWTLLDQNPQHDAPERDKQLVNAALTPQLPAGKHTSSLHTLRMLCFRKVLTTGQAQGTEHQIDENLYVERGANGPRFRRTFSPKNFRTDLISPPVMPEFGTLAATAEHVCEK